MAAVCDAAEPKGATMAKVLVLALSAPLLLIGAAYPADKPGVDADPYADEPVGEIVEAPITYRPCRPGPGDDRCIQLYERGVRAAYARWLRDHRVSEPETRVAMGGPVEEPRAHHPRRRHRDGPDRCMDRGRHDHHDGPMPHGEYDGEARGM